MKTSIMQVTPQLAKFWLSLNDRNRKVNPKGVADYARLMATGKWVLNGESIKRAHNGQLLDGQHRLLAVIEAGVAVEMLVIEDLEPEIQDTVDAGRKRTAADALSMDGVANASIVAAVGRRAWMWDQDNIRFVAASSPSISEVKETIEKYPHIHRSAGIGARTAMSYKPTRGAITGTAHHLFVQLDQDLTAEFFAQLALRNRLLNDFTNSKKIPFHQGLAFYIRAWNALREGRELSRIVHTADEPVIRPV